MIRNMHAYIAFKFQSRNQRESSNLPTTHWHKTVMGCETSKNTEAKKKHDKDERYCQCAIQHSATGRQLESQSKVTRLESLDIVRSS